MRAVGRENTEPEVRLRRALWHRGCRYRTHRRVAGVTPDIVFSGPRVAVFVDGCFWHGCPEHYSAPESNGDFWRAKLRRNQDRDRRDNRRLREEGWKVLRVWECEVRDDLDLAVSWVEQAICI